MTIKKFDLPSMKEFVGSILNKEHNTVLTNVTVIITTDEGQYKRVVEVPGKVLSVSIANLNTDYATDSGKDITF